MYRTDKFINGPINTARVEGYINGQKKILYLFMDMHLTRDKETECMSSDSQHIVQFLREQFGNTDKQIDFFFEIYSDLITVKQTEKRSIYIDQIDRLFKEMIEIKNNKVKSTFKNVRVHYTDIRSYITDDFMFNVNSLKKLSVDMWNTISIYDQDIHTIRALLSNLIKSYENLIKDIKHTKNHHKTLPIVMKDDKSAAKYTYKEKYKILLNSINKIKNQYNNNNTKQKINRYINTHLIDFMKKLIADIKKHENNILSQYRKITSIKHNLEFNLKRSALIKNLIVYITIMMDDIFRKNLNFFSRYIDCMFVRRFLDKEYITTGVLYSGSYHSSNIIFILLKYFNFKLTNIVYSNSKLSTEKINNNIKRLNDPNDSLHFIYPEVAYQCSNLKNFPINFE